MVIGILFSPSGKYMVTGSFDNKVMIIDFFSNTIIKEMNNIHKGIVFTNFGILNKKIIILIDYYSYLSKYLKILSLNFGCKLILFKYILD